MFHNVGYFGDLGYNPYPTRNANEIDPLFQKIALSQRSLNVILVHKFGTLYWIIFGISLV